uniref:RIIa domain-containing protein n=1 Tax=Macrostomum lignano TaxID=282301 RepID=A0A1I8GUB1_9PLAT
MSVPFSSTKLRVPRGFQSLLEGLAREVLRSQPADIYTFGAMYFEELIRRREETGDDDPAQLAAKVEDRFYNNTSFQQPTIDPSDPQQQDASKVIQTNFRRHAAQKEAAKLREDKAASEIQSAVRGHQEREAIKQSAPEQGSAEEVDIDLNDPEVEAAAAKIQAGFKGYKTRKDLLEKKNQPASAAADAEEEDSEQTALANSTQLLCGTLHIGLLVRLFFIKKAEDTTRRQKPKQKKRSSKAEDSKALHPPHFAQLAQTMLGCFGRRKKKNKDAAKPGGKSGKSNAPEPKASSKTGENDRTPTPAASKTVDNKQVRVTPQITIESPSQPDADKTATEVPSEVTETITVTRSQSMHQAPPKPGNIKKAATMSRYDFLRKQDNINYADRWASLKKRYLAAKPENGGVVGKDGGDEAETQPASRAAPKSPHRATVQSLPRQFSPPSNGPPSPVKFSDWFYDRQTREAEARQEFHDREERMRKIIEGPSKDELEEAAVKIQAGYKGYRTRKDMKAKREKSDEADEAKPVEKNAEEEEEVDIDLEDPEVQAAAVKIQQGWSSHKSRAKKTDQDEAVEPVKETASESAEENKHDEEEEVDIDLEDPEVQAAAVKIQRGWSSHKSRSKKSEDADGAEPVEQTAPEPVEDKKAEAEEEQEAAPDAGEEAEKPQQQDEAQEQAAEEPQENPEEEIDLNDPELAQAAIKIQAGFKGYQTRKKLKDETGQEQQDEAAEQKEAEEEQKPAAAEEEEKTDEAKGEADSDAANAVDPNDPAQNQAASKIQAGFRGMQARKEVAEMRKSGQEQGEAKSAEGESEEPAEGESEEPAEPAAVEDETEPEAKAEPESEAEADEAKPETEADEPQPEAEPEAESKPEAEPEAEPESEDKPEAEAEAEPEAPEAAESAAAAAAPGEEENEAAAPAAADDAAGAEGDEPRDE